MRRLPLLLAVLALPLWVSTAFSLDFRVYVATPERELRGARLRMQGRSTQPAEANATQHRVSALAEASRRALATVREDIETKISQRRLELTLAFLGQRGNATRPEDDPAVRAATLFIHRVTELEDIPGQGPGVELDVEVVYVLTRSAPPPPPGQSPLSLAPLHANKSAGEVDANASRDLLLRTLEKGIQNLEGLGGE